ncbi:hypothetical protein [Vibrio comitans]|nr:hypothetical protein [Vibrio comitans]
MSRAKDSVKLPNVVLVFLASDLSFTTTTTTTIHLTSKEQTS